ncbi:UDP-N-acetylmuramoyl-L-alanyl-D-glutamate--2,6-diaminopimelate ligase [bacterium F11]|nr:UDP-N-acetylmuramoyl-L-alanyl-D-glutamate--2,6-diaminopimelate ligase [bacterium F11]
MKTTVSPVPLSVLLKVAKESVDLKEDPLIRGLSYDSRKVREGDLFFAMKGAQSDAHDHLSEVIKKGGVAAIVERGVSASIPLIQTTSVLKKMSKMASRFYQNPTKKVKVIGVTGTNGKTTITYILENIFRSIGEKCGVLGTINYRVDDQSFLAPNTTPMSIDIHQFAHGLHQKGISHLVMEVSSHALELHRVDDVSFFCGIFTNLTQDHLDFHSTMENYFHAKLKLFEHLPDEKIVVNIDDPYGKKIAQKYPNCLRFGQGSQAQIKACEPRWDLKGVQFDLRFPSGQSYPVKTNLIGRHNISNLLASAGGGVVCGLNENQIVDGLNQSHTIPGRFERVEAGQQFVVVIDYAHTPDALGKALDALRDVNPQRLICVFGAGGDRDKRKRPLMGKIATQKADMVILTSDNPRTEDPSQILKDIEAGIIEDGKSNYSIMENREKAIFYGIGMAKEKDIVLIAGKGHENYQIYGKEKTTFSDQEVAHRALV